MKNTKKQIPWNFIWAFSLTAGMILAVGVFFDYYFDLNDDVLMKDILSGAYTGTPAGHNIQMLYPISAMISLFYRMPLLELFRMKYPEILWTLQCSQEMYFL